MKQVDIERKAADTEQLAVIMQQQAMDPIRRSRWYRFLETLALQAG
jgi:hypothetical protein